MPPLSQKQDRASQKPASSMISWTNSAGILQHKFLSMDKISLFVHGLKETGCCSAFECGVYVMRLLSGFPGANGVPIPNVLRIEATEEPIDDAKLGGLDC